MKYRVISVLCRFGLFGLAMSALGQQTCYRSLSSTYQTQGQITYCAPENPGTDANATLQITFSAKAGYTLPPTTACTAPTVSSPVAYGQCKTGWGCNGSFYVAQDTSSSNGGDLVIEIWAYDRKPATANCSIQETRRGASRV